jgi:putative hemolysin
VPFFFDGDASRPFQVASHLHYTLRMALLVNEFRIRGDAHRLMPDLRAGTSRLSPVAALGYGYGYDFEAGR